MSDIIQFLSFSVLLHTNEDNFQVHLQCCKWHYFLLSYGWYPIVSMYYIFFIHFSVSGRLDCSHVLAIVNMLQWTLGCIIFLNYALDICRRVGLLDHMILPHTGQIRQLEKVYKTVHDEEAVEKRDPSYTVGGNVNCCNHYGEQYGGSLKG